MFSRVKWCTHANDSLNKNDLTFSGIFELDLIYIGMFVQLSYIYETVCNYIKHTLNQEFIHNKTSYHSTTPWMWEKHLLSHLENGSQTKQERQSLRTTQSLSTSLMNSPYLLRVVSKLKVSHYFHIHMTETHNTYN